MSLPHTLFQCNKCKFCLCAGPDTYPSQGKNIWGRLAVCLECCEEHLIGKDYSDADPLAHAVFVRDFSQVSKKSPWPDWKMTAQSCELLPWFATGAPKKEEWVDVTRVSCSNCGLFELRLWLFHGIECPACKVGAVQELFTG